jgi:hypothetical protein
MSVWLRFDESQVSGRAEIAIPGRRSVRSRFLEWVHCPQKYADRKGFRRENASSETFDRQSKQLF